VECGSHVGGAGGELSVSDGRSSARARTDGASSASRTLAARSSSRLRDGDGSGCATRRVLLGHDLAALDADPVSISEHHFDETVVTWGCFDRVHPLASVIAQQTRAWC
jgi:hypothetical protein